MELCHAVYGITGNDGHVCHLHLTVIQDRHATDLFFHNVFALIGIFHADLRHKAAVDLFHDLIDTGEESGE